MNPLVLAACAGIMIIGSGLAGRPWSQVCLGLAVFAGLCSMIEALAMVRIHIDQVMRHGLQQHTELPPLTSAEYAELVRQGKAPP